MKMEKKRPTMSDSIQKREKQIWTTKGNSSTEAPLSELDVYADEYLDVGLILTVTGTPGGKKLFLTRNEFGVVERVSSATKVAHLYHFTRIDEYLRLPVNEEGWHLSPGNFSATMLKDSSELVLKPGCAFKVLKDVNRQGFLCSAGTVAVRYPDFDYPEL